MAGPRNRPCCSRRPCVTAAAALRPLAEAHRPTAPRSPSLQRVHLGRNLPAPFRVHPRNLRWSAPSTYSHRRPGRRNEPSRMRRKRTQPAWVVFVLLPNPDRESHNILARVSVGATRRYPFAGRLDGMGASRVRRRKSMAERLDANATTRQPDGRVARQVSGSDRNSEDVATAGRKRKQGASYETAPGRIHVATTSSMGTSRSLIRKEGRLQQGAAERV